MSGGAPGQPSAAACRYAGLDVVTGLMLLVVIVTHCGFLYDNDVLPWFLRPFFYVIAWFVFKAGMFHRAEEGTRAVLVRSVNRLLIPYAVMLVPSVLLVWAEYGAPLADVFKAHCMWMLYFSAPITDPSLWFLWALFWVKLLCAPLGTRRGAWIAMMALTAVGAWWACQGEEWKFAWPGNSLVIAAFYCGGWLWRTAQLTARVRNLLAWAGAALCVALGVLHFSYVEACRCLVIEGHHATFLAASMGACVALAHFSARFTWRLLAPLEVMGRDSMGYFLLHYPVLYLLRIARERWWPEMSYLLWMVMALTLCALLLPSLCRLYNRLVAPLRLARLAA